jgi:hypothetical protein
MPESRSSVRAICRKTRIAYKRGGGPEEPSSRRYISHSCTDVDQERNHIRTTRPNRPPKPTSSSPRSSAFDALCHRRHTQLSRQFHHSPIPLLSGHGIHIPGPLSSPLLNRLLNASHPRQWPQQPASSIPWPPTSPSTTLRVPKRSRTACPGRYHDSDSFGTETQE